MARLNRIRWWRGAVLACAAVYFLMPLVASFVFTVDSGHGVDFGPYTQIVGAQGFGSALLLSLELAVATIAVVLLLMVPAMTAVRIAVPRLRPVVEVVCSLPLVVPAIALAAGVRTVLGWGPQYLSRTPLYETFAAVQNPTFPVVLVLVYVVMALPFVYRTLDAGLRAVDVRTLMEAARNCGASWPKALWSVLLPNLRVPLLNASFLTFALVLGEYTVASLLQFGPFAVWIVNVGGDQAQLSVAVSVLSLLMTWLLLVVLSSAVGRRPGTSFRTLLASSPNSPKG
jgi:putative spermidine/putrescine transport system permease protein